MPRPRQSLDVVEHEDAPAGIDGAVQHRLDRDDVGADPRRAAGRATGSARWKPVSGGRDPVATMTSSASAAVTSAALASTPRRTSTPRAVQLPPEPGDEVGDLAARWLAPGEPELAAELRPALQERHVMAPLRRDASRLQPGRTAADDEHAPRVLAAGSNRSPPHSHSRPADGLTRQEIQ